MQILGRCRAEGVQRGHFLQNNAPINGIRSICFSRVSRTLLVPCSSSEVLRHPGEAARAPSRKELEEHRRSVGICLVNNSGLVFAARSGNMPQLAITFHTIAGTSQCRLTSKYDSLVTMEGQSGSSYWELPTMLHRRVDDKHGTWQMPQVSSCTPAPSSAVLPSVKDYLLHTNADTHAYTLKSPAEPITIISSLGKVIVSSTSPQWPLHFLACKQAPRLCMGAGLIWSAYVWALPCHAQGGIDSGGHENPMTAAVRELREETGISSARIVALVRHSPPHAQPLVPLPLSACLPAWPGLAFPATTELAPDFLAQMCSFNQTACRWTNG